MRALLACLPVLLGLAAPVPAPAMQGGDLDGAVAAALRASLLGDGEAIAELAARQAEHERQARPEVPMAGNLAALGIVTRRVAERGTVPSRRQLRAGLRGQERDGSIQSLERLLERTHPTDRLADAAASRRYEARRQVVNSLTGAAASAFQLQFFGLIQPPLDLIDYLVVKRHYLSPEERRELAVAEEILGGAPGHRWAGEVVTARRVERLSRTYALQARRNGEEAAERDRMPTAAWWFERERELRGWSEPSRKDHVRVLEALDRTARDREAIMEIAPSLAPPDPAIEAAAVRALLGGDYPGGETFWALDRTDRIALRAALEADPAQRLFRVNQLAREPNPTWQQVAGELRDRPEENPRRAMNEAKRQARRRIQSWLLAGDDPRETGQMLAPEEARQVESAWIQSARSAFVFDALTRAITYPLLPGRLFSRQEIIEASARVSEPWLGTEDATRSLREGSRALRKNRRFERAAVLAEEAGRGDLAESLRERQARALRRELRRTDDPAERLSLAQRILNAYPDFSHREEIERVRRQDRMLADALFAVGREDLRRHDAVTDSSALAFPPEFLDGRSRNGEVTDRGIFVLPGDRIAWIDRATGEVIVDPRPAENIRTAYGRWLALQRTGDVREVLQKPRERKRIPIALEGSAFPGVSVAPGLVPLEPDLEVRRYYE